MDAEPEAAFALPSASSKPDAKPDDMAFDFRSELSSNSSSSSKRKRCHSPDVVDTIIEVQIPWIPPKKRELFDAVDVDEYESETEYGWRYGRSRLRRAVKVRFVGMPRFP